MEEILDSLRKAKRQLTETQTMIAEQDKSGQLDDFAAGYEQAWIETAEVLLTFAINRLEQQSNGH